MSKQSIIAWVIFITSNLRTSQSATLAEMVAAVRTERPNLATIGRRMSGEVAVKHTIKRA